MDVTSDDNDGDARCSRGQDGKCFSWLPGGNLYSGSYDFTIYELYLPTKDAADVIDLGQIVWDVVVPADTDTLDVKMELTCGSSSSYFKNSTLGQPTGSATFIDATPLSAGHSNGYSTNPSISIADWKATIEYSGDYTANTVGDA